MILKPNTGIDISDYQPGLQIGTLNPLPRFVIIKATESLTFRCVNTAQFAAQCKAQGIPYGFYHFWQNTDPYKQANNYITHVNAAGGFERIPPVLDLEVSLTGQSANIKTWLDIIEDVAGKRPILYSNKSHFDMIAINTWFGNYDAWTAAYPANPDLWSWCPPAYSEKRARREIMWQYGSTYKYPNYTTNSVDTNIAITEFLNEIGAVTPPPPPPGGTMETWKCIAAGLKVRSGADPITPENYGQVQSLLQGDKVEGILDTAKNWIRIYKIIRVNGSTFSPTGTNQWWCSGGSIYMEKVIVEPPPPPPPVITLPVLPVVLTLGDDVTYAKQTVTINLQPLK